MRARYQPSRRLLVAWIGLLAFAQLADVLTTGADMSRGGVEANVIVVHLLALGGLGLVAFAKLLLVAAMAIAGGLVHAYALRNPGESTRRIHAFLWRSVQFSVVILVLVAVHNTALLAMIS